MATQPGGGGRDYINHLESKIEALVTQFDKRIESERLATALALTAADKTTAIAQDTADKAVAKAEAAAGKEYLESQISGLREALVAQIIAQKEAIGAALVSAKEALTAAQASSERAIAKAEESNEKRFQSVNEFRAQLGDQQKTFVTKIETEYRFAAIDKKFDEADIWRRRVDESLTEAKSKSGFIYSLIAIFISLSVLLVAILNLLNKS